MNVARNNVIYPGSFDPLTFGHLNIIERGLNTFGTLCIAVTDASPKSALFSIQERVGLISGATGNRSELQVVSFSGLLVNYMKEAGYSVILRGLRSVTDFEFELRMSQANTSMAPHIETLFMMTESRFSHLSSTLIKEIARLGGPLKDMVPPMVQEAIEKKLQEGV